MQHKTLLISTNSLEGGGVHAKGNKIPLLLYREFNIAVLFYCEARNFHDMKLQSCDIFIRKVENDLE